jgi:hypothetical protein
MKNDFGDLIGRPHSLEKCWTLCSGLESNYVVVVNKIFNDELENKEVVLLSCKVEVGGDSFCLSQLLI